MILNSLIHASPVVMNAIHKQKPPNSAFQVIDAQKRFGCVSRSIGVRKASNERLNSSFRDTPGPR